MDTDMDTDRDTDAGRALTLTRTDIDRDTFTDRVTDNDKDSYADSYTDTDMDIDMGNFNRQLTKKNDSVESVKLNKIQANGNLRNYVILEPKNKPSSFELKF